LHLQKRESFNVVWCRSRHFSLQVRS
jgi:hypothetical protein